MYTLSMVAGQGLDVDVGPVGGPGLDDAELERRGLGHAVILPPHNVDGRFRSRVGVSDSSVLRAQ